MKQGIVQAGTGKDYDWANDHVYVKAPLEASDGRMTLVEDTLKPGFDLARHHHRSMVEIFYILDGVVTFEFDEETITGGFDHYLAELAAMSTDELADSHTVGGSVSATTYGLHSQCHKTQLLPGLLNVAFQQYREEPDHADRSFQLASVAGPIRHSARHTCR